MIPIQFKNDILNNANEYLCQHYEAQNGSRYSGIDGANINHRRGALAYRGYSQRSLRSILLVGSHLYGPPAELAYRYRSRGHYYNPTLSRGVS
jgi:hypothetical protein